MRRIAALLTLILVVGACSGGDDAAETDELAPRGEQSSLPVEEGMADGADAAGVAAAPDEMQVDFDVVDDRKVIRRASLQLHSADTRATFDEIVRLTESVGGFVANAEIHPFEGEDDAQPDVSMTVRIPADQLTPTMAAIKDSVDEVVSESQGADDVTEQFVDLEARLRNLEALEVELRALLEEVRQQPDADPQKLLTVFNELSSVRGQIEQIQGQLNYLEDLTALATLTVHVSQTPEAAPIVEQPWEPMVAARDALSSLVTSLQDVADWGINFALYTLPMLLLILAIPGLIAFLVYRRLSARKGGESPPPAQPTPAES